MNFSTSELAPRKHRGVQQASTTLGLSLTSSSHSPPTSRSRHSPAPPSSLTVVLIELVDEGAHPIIPQLDDAIVQAGEDPRPLGVKAEPCEAPRDASARPPRTREPRDPEQPRGKLPAEPPRAPTTASVLSRRYLSPGPTWSRTWSASPSTLALSTAPALHVSVPEVPPADFRFHHLPEHRVSVLPPAQSGFRRWPGAAAAEEAEGLGRWRRGRLGAGG